MWHLWEASASVCMCLCLVYASLHPFPCTTSSADLRMHPSQAPEGPHYCVCQIRAPLLQQLLTAHALPPLGFPMTLNSGCTGIRICSVTLPMAFLWQLPGPSVLSRISTQSPKLFLNKRGLFLMTPAALERALGYLWPAGWSPLSASFQNIPTP